MGSSSKSTMDDKSFTERVKKTFGTLFRSLQPSPKSLSNPVWSLTDAQMERKEWRRDKDTSLRDSNPCSSSFNDFLDDDFNDWDVRSNIGLDSTLDIEEEEDTFDKVALGRENAGDRLYMSDVKPGHGSLNVSLNDLPGVVESRGRDPRANRVAANIRLKEDDEEAASMAEDCKPKQSPSPYENNFATSAESRDNLKPILKRKDLETTSKPSKRVRFDPAFISKDEGAKEHGKKIFSDTINKGNDEYVLNEKVSRVPDYLRNPSNYTRYSLDSIGETSDKSNSEVYLDFVEMVKKEENKESNFDSDIPSDITKSVTFVPKKKSDASKRVDNEKGEESGNEAKGPTLHSTFLDVASKEEENVVGDMEVDELEKVSEPNNGIMSRKQGRQYRVKPLDDEHA